MRPNFVRRSQSTTLFQQMRGFSSAVTLAMALALTGCGSLMGEDEPDTSAPLGSVVGPERDARGLTGRGQATDLDLASTAIGGFVLADEPTAALAARDVLESGGSAADAATALYFTLAVTHPAAAGLGGGGICLVHDAFEQKTESVEFLPRQASAGGPIAIPGNVRGFALLHARHGRQSWRSLLAAPERLAATGTPVSRAMARSLAPHTDMLRTRPELAVAFLSNSGMPLKELDVVEQIELASTLGLVRSRGVAALYGGEGVTSFSRAITEAGGTVSVEDLRNYRPIVADAIMVQSGDVEVYVPSSSVGAGTFASTVWQALQNVTPTDGTGAKRTAERTALTLGAPGQIPDDLGSTGFVTVSAQGDAVACAVTMNGSMGAAITARGTGVILASTPDDRTRGLASAFLAPLLATSPGNDRLIFAGASGGGPAAVAGVQQVLRQSFGSQRQDISTAIHNATPNSSVLVNALVCPLGLPRGFNACEIAVDPDGAGLGVEAIGR